MKILEIGVPIAAGIAAASGAELTGLADWFANGNIEALSRYNQQTNGAGSFLGPEFVRLANHFTADAALGMYVGVPAYFGLDKIRSIYRRKI